MNSKFAACLLILYLMASMALAEDGVWTTGDEFAQVNVFCVRVYKCSPAQDILYDESKKLIVSDPESSTGICSAGNGPVDSCNECLTNPPAKPCEWHLEPK